MLSETSTTKTVHRDEGGRMSCAPARPAQLRQAAAQHPPGEGPYQREQQQILGMGQADDIHPEGPISIVADYRSRGPPNPPAPFPAQEGGAGLRKCDSR